MSLHIEHIKLMPPDAGFMSRSCSAAVVEGAAVVAAGPDTNAWRYLVYPVGRCFISKPHGVLEDLTVHDALEMLVVDEIVEGVTEAGGLGDNI